MEITSPAVAMLFSLPLSRLLTIAQVHSVLIRGYIIMHTYVYIIPGHLVGDPVIFKITEN